MLTVQPDIYILVGIKCGGLFAQKGGELKLAGIHLAVTGYTGLSYDVTLELKKTLNWWI